jgi:predicted Zn-dependent protease
VLRTAAGYWPNNLQPAAGEKVTGAAANFLECVRTHCSAEKLKYEKSPTTNKLSASTAFHEQRWEVLARMPRPAEAQPQPWLQRGTAFVHLGNCENAIPALERGIQQNPEPAYGMFLLSWCYARQAGSVAAHLQQSGEDDALVHMMRGDVLLRLQANSAGAISEYKDALAKSPDDPAVLQRLGEAELAAGQMDAARATAQSALKLDPHRLPAMQTLAKIAMDERDYTAALPYLRQLLSHDPNDLTTRVQLGTACAQTGALAEALQNLAPALAQGYPDEKGSLHSLLGTVLRKMGRTSEANQAFAEARELSDNFQRSSRQDQKQVRNEPQ